VIKYADYLGAHVNELIELVNNLSAKVDEMNDQIADLNKRLEEEIKRAQEAEKQLQANIDAEAEARKEADQQLQANIDAEAEARQEADQQLQAKIDAETAARQQADQQLQTNINNEATAREQADQRLQAAIDAINGKLDAIQIESNNLYNASAKLPTVQAIINSTNQPISDSNKLATMADVEAGGGGGGGGGTTVNSIAPLTVETTPETQASESYAFGNGSEAGIKAVAIGETANATGMESVAIGNASLSGYQGTAIGYNTRAENNSVAIGRNSQTTESDTVSVGATDLKRRIINVATPVNGSDAATKDYVDSHSGGGGGGSTPVIDWANISLLGNGTSAFNASGQMIAPTAATGNGYIMLTLDYSGAGSASGDNQPNDATTVQAKIGDQVVASGVYMVNANRMIIGFNPSVIVPVAQGDSISVTNTPLGTPTTATMISVNMRFIPLK